MWYEDVVDKIWLGKTIRLQSWGATQFKLERQVFWVGKVCLSFDNWAVTRLGKKGKNPLLRGKPWNRDLFSLFYSFEIKKYLSVLFSVLLSESKEIPI